MTGQHESAIEKLTEARQILEWLEGSYIEAVNKGKSQGAQILDLEARLQQGTEEMEKATKTWASKGSTRHRDMAAQ